MHHSIQPKRWTQDSGHHETTLWLECIKLRHIHLHESGDTTTLMSMQAQSFVVLCDNVIVQITIHVHKSVSGIDDEQQFESSGS